VGRQGRPIAACGVAIVRRRTESRAAEGAVRTGRLSSGVLSGAGPAYGDRVGVAGRTPRGHLVQAGGVVGRGRPPLVATGLSQTNEGLAGQARVEVPSR
jgi:hypothetical protein